MKEEEINRKNEIIEIPRKVLQKIGISTSVYSDLANHASSLVLLVHRDLGSINSRWNLIFIENHVVREACIVLEHNGLSGSHREVTGDEGKPTIISAKQNLSSEGVGCQQCTSGGGNHGSTNLLEGGLDCKLWGGGSWSQLDSSADPGRGCARSLEASEGGNGNSSRGLCYLWRMNPIGKGDGMLSSDVAMDVCDLS
nr:hypothetical protein Csa_3G875435 [Ipomoea batatas]